MTLAPRSLKCLEGVHPDIAAVVRRADELGARFHLTCGLRTVEEQTRLVKAGKSKTMKSRHLTGHAVDFVVAEPGGGVSYDHDDMAACAGIFKRAALEMGIAIEWGGDWKSFVDTPHIELDRKVYKADGTKTPEPISVPSPVVAAKPLIRSRTLWNLGVGGSLLTWLGDVMAHGMQIVTEAGAQFAALAPSRDMLATVGGNSKTIAIGLGIGCLVSAACNKIGDSTPKEPTP